MANNTKHKESLVGFFENQSKYGPFYNSLTLTDEMIEKFGELKAGGRLKFRILAEDSRKKVAAFLDYVSPEEIEAAKAAREANNSNF